MKKLRATSEEREAFLKAVRDELYMGYYGGLLSDFSIEDIKKEFSAIPKSIIKPEVNITTEAYLKMLELVNQSAVECSWHGLVKRFDNKYIIYDVLVFPQINSPTSTTTDEKDFAEWQTKLILDIEFPIEELRLHGHSHVNMNVFSSGIDDKYQKDLLTKVEDGDYYIFFIMNKKMEICIFLYDFAQQVMFDKNDIDFKIISNNTDIREWAKEQLKEYATTERAFPKGKTSLLNYCDDDYSYSYFSKSKPIFKGVNNGSK